MRILTLSNKKQKIKKETKRTRNEDIYDIKKHINVGTGHTVHLSSGLYSSIYENYIGVAFIIFVPIY